MAPTDILLLPGIAAAAGLAGSAHCIAMCGGIATLGGAMAPTIGVRPRPSATWLFHGARIASYALLGATLALLARGTAASLPFRFERGARLALALAMAALALRMLIGTDVLGVERLGARAFRYLSPFWKRVMRAPNWLRPAALGLIWGLLPCGLVYSVLPLVAVSGSPIVAGASMVAFGIATVPALGGVSYLAARYPRRLAAPRARTAAGVALMLCALWTAISAVRHEAHAQHQHTAAPASLASAPSKSSAP